MKIMEKIVNENFHMIYIASCGEGINAYHLVQSALVQFPDNHITVVKVPHMRSESQVDDIMEKAQDTESLIVHTIVNRMLRKYISRKGVEKGIVTIDLMGPVLSKVEGFLDSHPIEKPGLYREIQNVDLDQVSAIEFALAHDDGVNPENLTEAEIILVGLSRAGKTPLAMYMAVLGWKTANVPLVIGVPMPDVIKRVDRRRIIALNINVDQLMAHRRLRQESLGTSDIYSYSSREEIEKEIHEARKYYISHGFSMIDVSNKPIETSAEEIIEMITRRFKSQAHKR
ncbi:putative enzyme [Desulfamplus magnetovallimortis]|uniref:Putative enzyme n=1 Tax=Desulfamplus magnetovallimortis TaxID=1246637 RepID=A0A1W1HCC6_9BACT|nr:pyruvate, water dikinase regulatory protein [Desulfamplus magnetovallimortis]SLM30035.1 putative enzyme [Desulfamplus magnetovallimortis]